MIEISEDLAQRLIKVLTKRKGRLDHCAICDCLIQGGMHKKECAAGELRRASFQKLNQKPV